jgi:BirA family biotin operon repressor/biotin-[acetyl-CoA-carboxylase] ligase
VATRYPVTVLDEVPSTQDLAREQGERGTPVVVVAHRQTAGRGRSGSVWETAPRAVAVSVAFESGPEAPLSLVAGVAARRVLGDRVTLKWPNDVLIGDDKVAGILLEGHGGLVVAGLGVNLYWEKAPAGIGALFDADPGPEAGPELAKRWAACLLDLIRLPSWPRAEYAAACATLGSDVAWEPDGRGTAVDVDVDGALVVATPAGEVRLSSGAVRHVRRAT